MNAASPRGLDLRGKKRENVRSQIAQVAFKVFVERGFDNVTARLVRCTPNLRVCRLERLAQ